MVRAFPKPPDDVPSPIDLRLMPDARAWEASALDKRPERAHFFASFAEALRERAVRHVLELGSGPGFLADHLLRQLPQLSYVALDFSAAMHSLARARLGDRAGRVNFVERSFREDDFGAGLGKFDAVVTLQAVHELRHKRHAARLHEQAGGLLMHGGVYLYCDHVCGRTMTNGDLYMTIEEQRASLTDAGFNHVDVLLECGSLALWCAR